MSIITSLTRMWLTRSAKPFVFKNEYDQQLPFSDCDHLGLYVHIPFCKSICSFCPYCKVIYSEKSCDRYVDALLREIHLVGGQYSGRKTTTSLYFGGGTPALAADRLKEISDAVLIYNIQKLERTHMSFNRGMDTENLVHLHNGVLLLSY